ncbi:MAG TPA: DUF1428 family protein [Rhizomicrobium sp.]|nr:DUF1428 family protein [Rhizomicrobium sp.]
MSYVDGFVIAVPKGKVDAYKAMAKECMPIWKEFGASCGVSTGCSRLWGIC